MRVVLIGLLACVLCTFAPSVFAQPAAEEQADPIARAQTLFDEGMALVREERWADAEARFAQALELRWSAPVAANLALAQSHGARLIEATLIVDDLLSREDEVDPAVREMAETLRAELQERLAYVHVEVPEEVDGERIIVSVDDVVAPPGPVAVNPGAHEIVARVGERVLGRAPANVSEGETVHIALADLAPDAAARAVVVEDGGGERLPEPPSRLGRRLGISLAAAAVVAAVLVVVFTAPYGTPGGQLDGDLGTIRVGE